MADRFWSKVDLGGDCWNWTASVNTYGYGQFRLGNRVLMAHYVAYLALIGEPERGKVIDHVCRNRRCVNPRHLEVVTNAENVRRGVLAKLNHELAALVRSRYAQGETQVSIAKSLGVSQSAVSLVTLGKAWANG